MDTNPILLVRFVLLAVALVLGFLAWAVWRRRQFTVEARAIAALLAAVSIYAFGYSGEVAQQHLQGAQRWLDVEYLGTPWIPALWLLAVRKRWELRPYTALLFVIPAIVFLGHITDPWLHLYNRSTSFVYRPPFWIVETDRGLIAWLNIGYLGAALGWGGWIWGSRLRRAQQLFRKQGALLICGSITPFAGYLIYLAGWSPYGLDMGSLTLSISALLGAYSIFALRCFELGPLAREHVFDCMRDAVLVLDMQERLIDFNPAARELLPSLGEKILGANVSTVLPSDVSLERLLSGTSNAQLIELIHGGELQHFEVRAFALKSRTRQLGWATILADVTAQVRLVRKLRRYAETDPLTGVSNRRRFFAALEEECLSSAHHQNAFSVLIIDLDRFKSINDRYGHPAGDRVLRTTTERINECLRGTDVLSRYGGEEFSVLLPLTGQEGALAVADRIRQAIALRPVEYENMSISLTASIGVASCEADEMANPELILQNADRALYRAKSGGRNRVEFWNDVLPAETTMEIAD